MPKPRNCGPLCRDPRTFDAQRRGGALGARELVLLVVGCGALLGWGCSRPEGNDTTGTPPALSPAEPALAEDSTHVRVAETARPGSGTLVDEVQLRHAFAGAPAAHQVFLEEALAVARTGRRGEAIEQFRKLLRHPGLTPAQQTAVEATLARLQVSPP